MGQDPYKYFRVEARELLEGLSRGVLDLEKGAGGPDTVGRLLRLAHTLKGASRVVKQSEIGDIAHAFEDSLSPFREGQGRIPAARIDELLRLLDAAGARLSALDTGPVSAPTAPSRSPGDEPLETVRVELGELDGLLKGIGAAESDLALLERDFDGLSRARQAAGRILEEDCSSIGFSRTRARMEELQDLLTTLQRVAGARLERASVDLAQIRHRSNDLRLLPAGAIFSSLERAARDAAQSAGRRVEFRAAGGEIRLDAHVLASIRDALLHVVRNAVAHGIEPEKARVGAGKAPAGLVEVSVERRGGRATFRCRDDGRGVDLDAVRQAAVRNAILTPARAEALSEEDAVGLLLKGGLSTTAAVTDLSGRGLGLGIVRETVSELKGELKVRTERGRSFSVSLTVPVSLSSLPAILLEAGGIAAAIPLDAVVAARRLAEHELARSPGGDSILHEGQAVPLADLSRILSKSAKSGSRRGFRSVVVVRSAEGLAAVELDRLIEVSSVLVRPLPAWIGADVAIAGAALDARGNAQLVLDPEGLVKAARVAGTRAEVHDERRLPVLVVDDSLTTRMLEQSILESAGYEVDLAVSGEEGLAKARVRRYGLFLVDVEMPGMDGFSFVLQAKSDPALRETPAILVTSRNAPEDRRRGEEVGASAYVVKSEFDQGRLLDLIGRLSG